MDGNLHSTNCVMRRQESTTVGLVNDARQSTWWCLVSGKMNIITYYTTLKNCICNIMKEPSLFFQVWTEHKMWWFQYSMFSVITPVWQVDLMLQCLFVTSFFFASVFLPASKCSLGNWPWWSCVAYIQLYTCYLHLLIMKRCLEMLRGVRLSLCYVNIDGITVQPREQVGTHCHIRQQFYVHWK